MKRLAEAIRLAAEIHERSWDAKTKKYTISLSEAADDAADKAGFDERGTTIVYLLLSKSWNESLDWAGLFIEPEEPGLQDIRRGNTCKSEDDDGEWIHDPDMGSKG